VPVNYYSEGEQGSLGEYDPQTGGSSTDPDVQERKRREAEEQRQYEESQAQKRSWWDRVKGAGQAVGGMVWDGAKWVATQAAQGAAAAAPYTPIGQAVQAGQAVASGRDVGGYLGYTPIGEAAESIGQMAHGKQVTGPGGFTPVGAAYNAGRAGINWLRDGFSGSGPMGPGGGTGESGLPAPGSLTDLRDKFLQERAGVTPYAPERVSGGPAGVVGLQAGDINQTRSMGLEHLRTLQDVAAGRTPSVADAQRRAAMLDATQSAYGLAGAAAPSQGAGGLRAALRATQEGGRRSGLDAALIQAKEISDARGQIGGQLEGMRTADQNLALAEAARLQNLGITDADRALRAGETNSRLGLDAYRASVEEKAGLGKLGLDAETTAAGTRLSEAKIQDMRAQLDYLYKKLEVETDMEKRKQTMAMIGTIVGAIGGVGAAAAGGA
jgi:hypothetical protein